MSTKQALEQRSLQYARYLDNMLRLKGSSKHLDIPTEHLTDYFSEGGELPHIEDGISVRDVVFGPGSSDSDKIPDEIILIGRGDDGFFGYTKSHPREVIALALAYRFLDMKLPYDKIDMSRKSGHHGMYASEFWDIMDEHKHLERLLEPCMDIEYDYEKDTEVSFYEMDFCGKDLGEFKDEMAYCSTEEEYICELFLADFESKFKSFTIFSTPDDVFSIDKVNSSSIY